MCVQTRLHNRRDNHATAAGRRCLRAMLSEIGVGLTGFGLLFLVLGMLFFFDKALLAMGNVRFHVHHVYALLTSAVRPAAQRMCARSLKS